MATRHDFLQMLYSFCEGTIELRALPSKSQKFYKIADVDGVDAFCAARIQENVYFAVATRDGGGKKEHIQDIPAVWVDIDFKDIPELEATEKLRNVALRPSAVIKSGGGYHAYWKLNEPAGQAEIARVEVINHGLAHLVTGDQNACDASRILRMPETFNCKYTPHVPVQCIFLEDRVYDLTDFEDILSNFEIDSFNACTNSLLYSGAQSTERPQESTNVHKQPISFSQGGRDATLFHIANHLAKGRMPEENIKKTIYFLARNCNPPFTESEAEAKIRSALDRSGKTGKSLVDEITEWVESTKGHWKSTEVHRDLHLSTKREKKTCSQILSRLVKDEKIERYGKQAGWFRVVDKNCEVIDFMNTEATTIKIRWPFQIEAMVETMPKNIIVIAGEPNTGKSAMLLNIVDMNIGYLKNMPIHYFSSEMAAPEFRKRLEKFDRPLKEWDFNVKERSSDFADVINPNGLNLIDFLEVHENFYEVGGMLRSIYDKLDTGIAVIALQKNELTDYGLGGMRSLEKPRLYLAIKSNFPGGILKIVKGKNWATEINPNGYQIKFKLLNGSKFITEKDWHLPEAGGRQARTKKEKYPNI